MKIQNSKQFRKFVICNLLLVTVYLSLFTCSAFAESSASLVKNANKFYKNKKYDNALKEYNRALTKYPDSAIINFDIGAAQYKKGDYEKALSSFTKALTSENRKLEAKANYNIGNCKYKQAALKENTDLSSAVSLLRDSLDYYKRAIELDEESKNAKFNHEFVEKKLKVLLDKLKKQRKEREKQKSKDKEQKGNEEKQQNSTNQQNQKEEKESESNKKGEQKQIRKEQQKDFDKKEQKQGNESQKQEAEKLKEMSEQEAKMLLDGYKHEEESKDKLKKIRPQGYYPEVLKDW